MLDLDASNSNSTEHKIAMSVSDVFKLIILRSFRCELIFGRFLFFRAAQHGYDFDLEAGTSAISFPPAFTRNP